MRIPVFCPSCATDIEVDFSGAKRIIIHCTECGVRLLVNIPKVIATTRQDLIGRTCGRCRDLNVILNKLERNQKDNPLVDDLRNSLNKLDGYLSDLYDMEDYTDRIQNTLASALDGCLSDEREEVG